MSSERDCFLRIARETALKRENSKLRSIIQHTQHLVKVMKKETLKDTNNYAHSVLSNLDKDQMRFATSPLDRNIISLSGPGSGKTTTMLARIIYLIAGGCDPRKILVLTYTRKAQDEFENRYITFMNSKKEDMKPNISTFHSFSFQTLRKLFKEDRELVFDVMEDEMSECRIEQVSEKQYNKIMRGIKKNLKLHYSISIIERLVKLARYLKTTNKPMTVFQQSILHEYNLLFPKSNKVLYIDYLECLLLLKKAFSRGHIPQQFQFLLVDEAQDTDAIMFDLIRFLSSCVRSVTCVGDSWQQIYSYSGLSLQNFIESFKSLGPNLLVELVTNYRSHSSIVRGIENVKKGKTESQTLPVNFEYRIFNITSSSCDFFVNDQYELIDLIVPDLIKCNKTVLVLFRRNAEKAQLEKIVKKRRLKVLTSEKAKKKQQKTWLDSNHVQLSVGHKVKGGEADIVIICNLIEMNFPLYADSYANKDDDPFGESFFVKLEQEKKLFYVCVSRARELVLLFTPTFIENQKNNPEFRSISLKQAHPSEYIKNLGDVVSTKYSEDDLRKDFLTQYIEDNTNSTPQTFIVGEDEEEGEDENYTQTENENLMNDD